MTSMTNWDEVDCCLSIKIFGQVLSVYANQCARTNLARPALIWPSAKEPNIVLDGIPDYSAYVNRINTTSKIGHNKFSNSLIDTGVPDSAERSAAKHTACVSAASSRSGNGFWSLIMQSRK